MQKTRFHHGDLRRALLDEAASQLEAHGAAGLSLRQLASAVGVSHAAPRRHFVDRQALLNALAARGFDRVAGLMRSAGHGGGIDGSSGWIASARAFVDFASQNPALMDVMFTAKTTDPDSELRAAAANFFTVTDEALGEHSDTDRLLVAATLQGIASMRASSRIDAETAEHLVVSASAIFAGRPATAG